MGCFDKRIYPSSCLNKIEVIHTFARRALEQMSRRNPFHIYFCFMANMPRVCKQPVHAV